MTNLNTTSLITNRSGINKMSQVTSIYSSIPKLFNHPHSVATQRAAGCIAIGLGLLYLVKCASDSIFKNQEKPRPSTGEGDTNPTANPRTFSIIASRGVSPLSHTQELPRSSYKRKDLVRFIISLVAQLSPGDRQKVIQLCLQYCLQLNAKASSVSLSPPKRELLQDADEPSCSIEAEGLPLATVEATIPEELTEKVEGNKLSILAILNRINRTALPPSFMRRALKLIQSSPVVSGREDILIKGLKIYDIPPEHIRTVVELINLKAQVTFKELLKKLVAEYAETPSVEGCDKTTTFNIFLLIEALESQYKAHIQRIEEQSSELASQAIRLQRLAFQRPQ